MGQDLFATPWLIQYKFFIISLSKNTRGRCWHPYNSFGLFQVDKSKSHTPESTPPPHPPPSRLSILSYWPELGHTSTPSFKGVWLQGNLGIKHLSWRNRIHNQLRISMSHCLELGTLSFPNQGSVTREGGTLAFG